MTIAYSYVRISTKEQMKGASLNRQLEVSEKYAKEHGLVLDTVLKMHDIGVSGHDESNITKGALGKFIIAIDKGIVQPGSFLLVESLDRLSRAAPRKALERFLGIIDRGVRIVTLKDMPPTVYSEASVDKDPMLLFGSIMVMIRAHEESAMKSKRIGDAWEKKINEALAGKADGKILTTVLPMWMHVVDGKPELIPERVAVIQRIFQMLKDGSSMRSVAIYLNQDVQPWGKARKWESSYISKMTRNTAIYGAFESNGKVGEIGYYPAVISKEDFDYVRYVLSQRWSRNDHRGGKKRGASLTNLFSGITTCGYCGAKMHVGLYVSHSTGKRKVYLGCSGARNGSSNCKSIAWKTDELEALFFFKVSQVNIATAVGANHENKIEALDKELMVLIAEMEQTQKKIQNLYDAIAIDPIPGLIKNLRTLEDLYVEQERSRHQLESNLNYARMNTAKGSNRMRSLMTLFKTMKTCDDELSLRRVRESLFDSIRNVVTSIVLYPSGPTANKANVDMRYAIITFKSGKTMELCEG